MCVILPEPTAVGSATTLMLMGLSQIPTTVSFVAVTLPHSAQ